MSFFPKGTQHAASSIHRHCAYAAQQLSYSCGGFDAANSISFYTVKKRIAILKCKMCDYQQYNGDVATDYVYICISYTNIVFQQQYTTLIIINFVPSLLRKSLFTTQFYYSHRIPLLSLLQKYIYTHITYELI